MANPPAPKPVDTSRARFFADSLRPAKGASPTPAVGSVDPDLKKLTPDPKNPPGFFGFRKSIVGSTIEDVFIGGSGNPAAGVLEGLPTGIVVGTWPGRVVNFVFPGGNLNSGGDVMVGPVDPARPVTYRRLLTVGDIGRLNTAALQKVIAALATRSMFDPRRAALLAAATDALTTRTTAGLFADWMLNLAAGQPAVLDMGLRDP